MTRRELFAMVPAAVALNARGAETSFERIDTHTHIHRAVPALVAMLEQTNWRVMSICDSREIGDEKSVLPEMIPGTIAAHRESKGRIQWATTFDPRGFDQPGFAERAIAGIQDGFKQGAIAVKIWKNIGMGIKSKTGEWVLPDNPAFTPIFEVIQKAGKTLVAHLAEPNAAWGDPTGPDAGYYKSHPEWSMANKPGAPSKEAILDARDRVLARMPKLRMVGCHFGSNEEDLDALAKRLDAHPNFAVDMASRVRYLQRGDHAKAKAFLLKYQERIIYGTDFTLGADEARGAKQLDGTHNREYSFFAGDEASQGLALPEAILRKLFRENAVRWYPGILG